MPSETFTKDTESKNDVFNAYNELLRKLQDTPKVTTPEIQEEQIVEQQIVEEEKFVVATAVKETSTGITEHVANLKSSVNDFLGDIENKLHLEQEKVETLRKAIIIQNQHLEDLYEIRVNADTLAALVLANKEKAVSLEQEISFKRQQWQKEQDDHELKTKDRDDWQARERQREEEEYTSRRDILREKSLGEQDLAERQLKHELESRRFHLEEEFRLRESKVEEELRLREGKVVSKELDMQNQLETTKRHLEQEYSTKRAHTEEELKKRERGIIQSEQEFLLLKERVDKFPEEMQHLVTTAEERITKTLTLEFEYKTKLAEQEFETVNRLHKQALELLEAKNEHLESLNYSFKPMAYNPSL